MIENYYFFFLLNNFSLKNPRMRRYRGPIFPIRGSSLENSIKWHIAYLKQINLIPHLLYMRPYIFFWLLFEFLSFENDNESDDDTNSHLNNLNKIKKIPTFHEEKKNKKNWAVAMLQWIFFFWTPSYSILNAKGYS